MENKKKPSLPLSRRSFVTAAVVAATSTAGCGGAAQQTFEAPPVRIPDGDYEPLQLGEVGLEEITLAVDGPGNTEVGLTNHASVYDRTVGTGGR